ncbi:NusA-like transcription termination signal-binding factor [Methanolobus zinderi]|uniref:Probable transcription termination protein NusA n=1 Tax=Methanolobus zinderi TaxID=536044 RepID=A0A7D5EFV2_9EURY|nr:NusA-like transcription termination signal-binding factor [Methanolobus zinderi]KXS43453.1 MAG: transcription elongation factor NusA-like protein [Methanolobus sp. T82-4]QLC49380.1 NusA-like transcription termination signal-binding factor [Methanolobus zinderi]
MSEIKLSTEGIRYIALFEKLTGATVRDCIIDDGRIIYVIKAGDMGAAIGKNGDHINRMKKTVDKHIDLVEYSEEPVTFIKNAFGPVTVKSVNIVNRNNKRLAYVEVSNKDKGLAIGRNGKNIEKVKLVAKRHHDIDDVILQ